MLREEGAGKIAVSLSMLRLLSLILVLCCLVLGCAPQNEEVQETNLDSSDSSSLESTSTQESQNLLMEDLFPETREVVLSFNDDPQLIAPRTYASLTGILQDKVVYAIIEINGKAFILQQGQAIKGFCIREISHSRVLLVKDSSAEAKS